MYAFSRSCGFDVGPLSVFCWLAAWIYWEVFAIGISHDSVAVKIVRGVSFVGSLSQFLAILVLDIGLIVGGKRVQQA